MSNEWLTIEERRQYEARLADLRMEHRDLDDAIKSIEIDTQHNQLQVRRMKKRKLLLKDQIAWLERQLEPDVPA